MNVIEQYPDFIIPAREGGFRDYIHCIKYVLSFAKKYLLNLPTDQQDNFMEYLNVLLKKWYDESGWAPFQGFDTPYQMNGMEGNKFITESGNVNGFTREVSLNGKVIEKESYWHGEYKFERL